MEIMGKMLVSPLLAAFLFGNGEKCSENCDQKPNIVQKKSLRRFYNNEKNIAVLNHEFCFRLGFAFGTGFRFGFRRRLRG